MPKASKRRRASAGNAHQRPSHDTMVRAQEEEVARRRQRLRQLEEENASLAKKIANQRRRQKRLEKKVSVTVPKKKCHVIFACACIGVSIIVHVNFFVSSKKKKKKKTHSERLTEMKRKAVYRRQVRSR